MAYQAPYSGLAQLMEMQGRGPDTRLVHMTPMELRTLQAMSPTGRLTTNPETGLPEAGILEDILPIALPIAGSFLFPMAAPALFGASSALAAPAIAGAIGTGLGSTAAGLFQGKGLGDSLIQGGLSGLMSYGLGSLSSAFAPSGGVTATPVDPATASLGFEASGVQPFASEIAKNVTPAATESTGFLGSLGEKLSAQIAPETLGGATYGSALGAGGSGLLAAGLLEEPYDVADVEMEEYDYYMPDLEAGRARGRAMARTPTGYYSPSELLQMATTRGYNPPFLAAEGGRVPKNLNINGQPHELSYINQDEADLLRSLGGAGQNVMGIPAYFDAGEGTAGEGAADDGSGSMGDDGGMGGDDGGGYGSPGDSMGLGGYSDSQAAAVTAGLDAAMDAVASDAAYSVPEDVWSQRSKDQAKAPGLDIGIGPLGVLGTVLGVPMIGTLADKALGLQQNISLGPDTQYGDTFSGYSLGEPDDMSVDEAGSDSPMPTYRRPYGDPYNTEAVQVASPAAATPVANTALRSLSGTAPRTAGDIFNAATTGGIPRFFAAEGGLVPRYRGAF